jgi:hypothetical protein
VAAQPPAAPALRTAPAVAKALQKAAPPAGTPASTRSPAPALSPTPTPSPTSTGDASPLAAAGVPTQKLAGGPTGRPASSTVSLQMIASVLFLAAVGGASVVWLARRVRV